MRNTELEVLVVLSLILFGIACSKPESSGNGSIAGQPTAPQPIATQPATPPPTFSAADKLHMFAFAKNNQSSDQQLRDESDCYSQVKQQTGINPEAAAPAPPSAADVQAAQQQAAENAPQAKGGRLRGAARGALGGAAIGGIAGDAGKGAAVGAVVGTMRGGKQQRQANEQSKQEAANSATAQTQQQYNQTKAAYDQQMSTFKRGFSACMDARGYSIK